MAQEPKNRTVEQELRDLANTLGKYTSAEVALSGAVVTDLDRALHGFGDHLANLHRRIEKLEEQTPEWTTKGWGAPPGD
ncbi:MAG: hypothetical protein ABSG81_11995 [Acidimicrobiales bacterium]|jgi:hypothetical protein